MGGGTTTPQARAAARNTKQHGHHHNAELLLMALSSYYRQPGVMERVLPVIEGTAECSLRLIDWFVTNYAKKNNTILSYGQSDAVPMHVNVYLSYRAQLKAYSKQQFDPFRRRERIMFYYAPDKAVETTIGQLNFFRWVLQNHVLEYIQEHADDVEKDMLSQQRGGTSAPPSPGNSDHGSDDCEVHSCRKKRVEISKSLATRNMNLIEGTRHLLFD